MGLPTMEEIRRINRRTRMENLDPKLQRLYVSDPTIHAALQEYVNGPLSLADALTFAVVAQHAQKESLMKQLERKMLIDPIIIPKA